MAWTEAARRASAEARRARRMHSATKGYIKKGGIPAINKLQRRLPGTNQLDPSVYRGVLANQLKALRAGRSIGAVRGMTVGRNAAASTALRNARRAAERKAAKKYMRPPYGNVARRMFGRTSKG